MRYYKRLDLNGNTIETFQFEDSININNCFHETIAKQIVEYYPSTEPEVTISKTETVEEVVPTTQPTNTLTEAPTEAPTEQPG